MVPGKTSIDPDTLKGLIANRFQIMANYSKQVVSPILKTEKHNAAPSDKDLLSEVGPLLTREPSIMTPDGKKSLDRLLASDSHKTVQLVYQFQEKLKSIWMRTTASQKELIEAFQEWCKQAEGSGLDVLKDFAAQLKGYTVSTA